MIYTQHIETAVLLADEQKRLSGYTAELTVAQAAIRSHYENKTLPLLHLPAQPLESILTIAARIREQKQLVVLGTGGSSLGGQALLAFSDGAFPIYFFDNLDAHTLDRFLATHDMTHTHLLIVSKSGGTVETLTQALLFLAHMENRIGKEALARHCHAIATPGDNALRALASYYAIPVLDHDPDVGGRYSVLSLVGLIPAAAAGIDIKAILQGAASMLDHTLASPDAPPLLGAAWQCALMPTRPISIWMPYCDRLTLFGAWVQQLWAESLGKEGLGSTPVRALGAVDQHSQLQLYLDGPKDKSFNLITLPHQGAGERIDARGIAALSHLHGRHIGDVMASLQYGTTETFRRHQLPLRILELAEMNESTLGALLMHLMLETIAAAVLLQINAFDQPAVEESKNIARDYLRTLQMQGSAA